MPPIRVLVVEDSLTVRKYLCEVLRSDPGIAVVGEASDGSRAIELCRSLRPDVVTMDMMLPVMSGLAATEYIMAHYPTPILIVSASTNRGELFKTYEALAAGALDVLEKPAADDGDAVWARQFLATIKVVARIRVITHPRARLGLLGRAETTLPMASAPHAAGCEVVAIGASTGGPAAIVDILRMLPPSFPVPVLFVLHIAEPFATAFADWLDGQTSHRVSYAKEAQIIRAHSGQVLMAPPEAHLTVSGGRARLTLTPPRHSCRPSIDVLFESIAREYGAAATACLLTGMGRDGAAGLLEVRRAGGLTIAQDEATSVVYGMPREAAILGAAERILPLGEIGPALTTIVTSPRVSRA
jgi:two-component system, chemotaxis family, protein-glutamate methylesterase/glutaminase